MHLPITNTVITQVGLTYNQTSTTWRNDIVDTKEASIDGFALNIGPKDGFTGTQLRQAYDAANDLGEFSLFLSFDFSTDGWTTSSVANLTNLFKDEPSQFKVDGKPLVSTFEGSAFADSWKDVRANVSGDIYFVPDWTSLTADGVEKLVDDIDGHCEFSVETGCWKLKRSNTSSSLFRCLAASRRDAHDRR